MRRLGLALCLALVPLTAAAQTDTRDYLTAFLEDNLSGAGRKVVVTGFEGALSSRAVAKQITIADDQGIWLTITGVTLDWSRSALLQGEILVNDLSAQDIVLERMPVAQATATKPEAGSFALPDLPVSVQIDHLAAAHIRLGPSVLGSAVEATLQASMALAGGEGHVDLALQRRDAGPAGRLALSARYGNADQRLSVDLTAEEAAGGIAATLLGVPGAPATKLTVRGDGPLRGFAADVALSTDGVDRLGGAVTLTGAEGGALGFGVDLSGNLAPLFLPDYAAFFGDRIVVQAEGRRWPDGRLEVDKLALVAQALHLDGQLSLAADGVPQRFDLTGHIADPAGRAILLPYPVKVATRVSSADVTLHFDASQQDLWRADIAIKALERADFRAAALNLNGTGHIARTPTGPQIDGTFTYLADGLVPQDTALAKALGDRISGAASLGWHKGDGSFGVQKLSLTGADYGMTLSGHIAGLAEALALSGTVEVTAADLSRFAGLLGQPIAGAGDVTLAGSGSPLTGAFDVQANLHGKDLALGVARLDAALRGDSVLTASLRRDGTGTALRSLHIAAQAFSADASGTLASAGSTIDAALTVSDLGGFGAGYRGAMQAKGHLSGVRDDLSVILDASGHGLGIGQAEADKLLAGDSTLSLGLTLRDGILMLDRANLTNPAVTVQAAGRVQGQEQTVTIQARLADLALLLPDFPGALSVTGTLMQTPQGMKLDLAGAGPGQINATVTGDLATNFASADLAIKGTALAGLANPFIAPRVMSGRAGFDLRLKGPLALRGLSGPVTLSDARLADPGLAFGIEGLSARADLAAGVAGVTGSGQISSGGQVDVKGTVALAAPYVGNLAVDIRNALLRDPDLYEVRLAGGITLKGPLAGAAVIAGRLALADTELRVPAADFGAAGGLPDLQHSHEPGDVHATRVRAGLVAKGAGGAAPPSHPYGLDLVISAPSRLFVRGRGLDAELGGELHLTGSTAAVVPVGSFDLIRGRLEILGRRLDLTTASLQMQGALLPFIHVVAAAQSDGATVGVDISGAANDPVVQFTSSPALPEEEILARLLFGNNVENLSVLQAIELASAVRTLAGRGGEGTIAKLRKSLGLDNLDLKTSASGGSTVTAGKYLSKKVYTELTVDATGQSEIHLNLDVTKSITLRGTAASDGTSSLGVLVEKDY